MARRLNYVALTDAQLEAVKEAMASRLAGPIDGSDQRQETYEAADDALADAVKAEVGVFLTRSQAGALMVMATESDPRHTFPWTARGRAAARSAQEAQGLLRKALGHG